MADSDTLTMPPAGVADDTEEQRRRMATLMPPAATPTPPPTASSSSMPPFVMNPNGTPEPGTVRPQPSPTPAHVMPPAQVSAPNTPVPGTLKPEASSNGPAGFIPPAQVDVPKPQFGNMNAPALQPPQLSGWKKYLDSIGSIFPIGRAIETGIPGTPQNFEEKEAERQGREERQAGIAKTTGEASEAQGRARLTEAQAQQLGNMVPVTLPNGQTIYLNEKDATAILGKQVQGATATDVAKGKEASAEKIAGGKEASAEKIATGKEASAETIAGGKAPTTKTVMVNGKPEVMGWNPQTKAFDIPIGEAPPTYASAVMPTKTIDTIDDNGMPQKMGWNEKTQKYDIPMGVSASGAAGGRITQAGAVTRAADNLIADIKANRAKLGNMKAIVQSAILDTPWADPETAQLRAEIASFAALNPAMHGFRGTDALREFEKLIGGIPNNPDAMIAAIEGIKKTAGAVEGKPGAAAGPPAAQPGMKVQQRTVNGKTEYRQVPIGR